jgi:hypothetical protein
MRVIGDRIAAHLRYTYGALPVAPEGFGRPLARCDLGACHGMCCHDGVYLDTVAEGVVTELVDARRADFAAMGLDLPAEAVVSDGPTARKTATRPWNGVAAMTDFAPSVCVFHLPDGRCGFQVLAMQDGVHPWTYKPHACWLFPISIHRGSIALHDDTVHPTGVEGYNRFVVTTCCGGTRADGQPAVVVLAEELRYLGAIFGRDLIAEIEAEMTSR